MSPIVPKPVRHAATALGFAVKGAAAREQTAPADVRAQIVAARTVAKKLADGLGTADDLAGAHALLTECRATLAHAFEAGAEPPAHGTTAALAAGLEAALRTATATLDADNLAAMPFLARHSYAITLAILGFIASAAGGLSALPL